VAVLIPSIDLMAGKIVQLVQGRKKVLEYSDFDSWVERFAPYPLVQLIDLDAAMRQGDNRPLLRWFLSRLPCQVGGGIRDVEAARALLDDGAARVIFGSSLIRDGAVNTAFAEQAAAALGPDRIVAAVDSHRGRVAVRGWAETTEVTAVDMLRALESYCGGFLYTHIDTEGLMKGIPMDVVQQLRQSTARKLIVAGGISSWDEIEALDEMGVDAVVGMALYTGKLAIEPDC
jgi:phosphoribosylformimino-5-aminoimidazole carboxamide ribotide isomerase